MSIVTLIGVNGKKTYRAIVYNKATKKNESKTFKEKKDAKAWDAYRKNQFNHFQATSPQDIKKKTINDIVDMYEDTHSIPKSEVQYIREVRRMWGKYIYVLLTAEMIEAELKKERDAGLLPNSIHKKFKELRKIIKWVRMKPAYQLHINCCDAVTSKQEKDDRSRILTDLEIEYLYKSLDEYAQSSKTGSLFRDLFTCLLNTGCRVSELLQLEMQMVDLESGLLILPPRILKGKPTSGRQAVITTPTEEIFKRLTSKEKRTNNFVFKNHFYDSSATAKLYRKYVIPRAIEIYLEDCKRLDKAINEKFLHDTRLHDLRHTFVAWCYIKPREQFGRTMTDLEVSKLSGHEDLKSLKRYANIKPSDLKDLLW